VSIIQCFERTFGCKSVPCPSILYRNFSTLEINSNPALPICSDSDMAVLADRLSTVRNCRFCMYGGKGHCSMEIFAGKNDCASTVMDPLCPFASTVHCSSTKANS